VNAPDDLPPESRFGEAISILNRAALIYLTRELAPYRLGPGQQAYLLTLTSGEAVSQDEIARRHRVDKANAARAAQALERLGYVRRVRSSDDRRRWDVSLTREGAAVRAEVQRILGGWVGSLAEAVSSREWETTVSSLTRMAEAAMERAREASGDAESTSDAPT
jgi:DNA-binding MarR family transcriptional regulator